MLSARLGNLGEFLQASCLTQQVIDLTKQVERLAALGFGGFVLAVQTRDAAETPQAICDAESITNATV